MSFHTSNDQSSSQSVPLKPVEKSCTVAIEFNGSVEDTTLQGPAPKACTELVEFPEEAISIMDEIGGLPLLEHHHPWSFSNDSVSVDLMMFDEISKKRLLNEKQWEVNLSNDSIQKSKKSRRSIEPLN